MQQAANLFAYAVTLLRRKDDSGVLFALSQILGMKLLEVALIAAINCPSLGGGEFKLFRVGQSRSTLFDHRGDVDPAQAKVMRQRARWRIFIEVKSNLHQAFFLTCSDSFARRSYSACSRAMSVSISALLAW